MQLKLMASSFLHKFAQIVPLVMSSDLRSLRSVKYSNRMREPIGLHKKEDAGRIDRRLLITAVPELQSSDVEHSRLIFFSSMT